MLKFLEKYSLKKQMIILTTGSYVLFLSIMFTICISVFLTTNNRIKNDSEEALYDQNEINVEKVLDGTSLWLTQKLFAGKEGFVSPIVNAMSDTYRTDYSMGNSSPSYFEYGDTYLAQPLEQDERQIKPVSLIDSSYYIPESSPSSIQYFSAEINQTRSQSALLDPFFKPLYQNYEDFVAVYIGFQDDGLFEHYPGTGTLDTDPTRSYDSRVRGWYVDTLELEDELIFTSPYQDFNGKGWMITIAQVLRTADGLFEGVVGSDMLISTINKNLAGISFLDSGKVTLFETSGTVVSDREWDADPDDPNGMDYSDLQDPPVSDSLWTEISETDIGSTSTIEKTIDDVDYLITVNRIEDIDGQYILVTWIVKSEITEPIDSIIDEMNESNTSVSLGLAFAFVIFIVVSVIVITIIANKITKPLDNLGRRINNMIRNIGTSDIFRDEDDLDTENYEKGFGKEQTELYNGFNEMISVIRDQDTGPVNNQFYGGKNELIMGYSNHEDQRFPEGAIMFNPTAPPVSESEL